MSQHEIRTKIDAAVEYLTDHPADARYTDSPATAVITDPAGLKAVVSGPDGAALTTDMPTSIGGANSAPSAGWFLRAAEASCVATLIAMRAAHEGVEYERLEVTIDSESDDRGILGMDESVPAGPLRTSVRVRVGSVRVDDEDDDVWDTIVAWAVEHCPVTDAVRRAVPLTYEMITEKDPSGPN
jgi:uncharacterized OsmC-like protein